MIASEGSVEGERKQERRRKLIDEVKSGNYKGMKKKAVAEMDVNRTGIWDLPYIR